MSPEGSTDVRAEADEARAHDTVGDELRVVRADEEVEEARSENDIAVLDMSAQFEV